jgi:ABC-type phosphate transport system substrate-binding protein
MRSLKPHWREILTLVVSAALLSACGGSAEPASSTVAASGSTTSTSTSPSASGATSSQAPAVIQGIETPIGVSVVTATNAN